MNPVKKTQSQRQNKEALVLPNFAKYFFMIGVLSVTILFLWVISPFFSTLILGALTVIIFHPVQAFLLKKTKGSKTFSAFITSLFVLLVIFTPLVFLSIYLAQEAIETYTVFEYKLNAYDFGSFKALSDIPYVGGWLEKQEARFGVQAFFSANEFDLVNTIKSLIQSVTTFVVNQTGVILKGLTDGFLQFFIFLITIFYLFRDGDRVIAYLKRISPLPKHYEDEIAVKLKESTKAIVVGNFGTSLLQGLAGGIGFAIAGVDNVILWMTFMVFASLIPYVGSAIIWVPVALSLIFAQNYFWGVFLIIWGLTVVGTIDNIVRPFLIGNQAKMHALGTFLVVVGGILTFGLKGIIYGPLILSIMITIIHIYEKEYKNVL